MLLCFNYSEWLFCYYWFTLVHIYDFFKGMFILLTSLMISICLGIVDNNLLFSLTYLSLKFARTYVCFTLYFYCFKFVQAFPLVMDVVDTTLEILPGSIFHLITKLLIIYHLKHEWTMNTFKDFKWLLFLFHWCVIVLINNLFPTIEYRVSFFKCVPCVV